MGAEKDRTRRKQRACDSTQRRLVNGQFSLSLSSEGQSRTVCTMQRALIPKRNRSGGDFADPVLSWKGKENEVRRRRFFGHAGRTWYCLTVETGERGKQTKGPSPRNREVPTKSSEAVTKISSSGEKESGWKIFAGNLAAGAVAGCTVEGVLYPIDTIKTRLQMMRSGGGLRALFKGGGSGKLYSGLLGNLAGVGPATALFFGVYEPFKEEAAKVIPAEMAPLVAGGLAGIVTSIIRVPTEVVKQRMQTGQFTSAFGAISTITKQQGVKGLFAGYNAFLLRDLPFDAFEFASYEALKSLYSRFTKRRLNAAEAAVTGAIAGGFTGLVTTPFDVLKTRLMTQGSSGQYSGLFDAVRKIAAEEGPGAFLKGWQARLLWISIGGCVFFTALEEARNVFVPSVVDREHQEAAKSQ